MQAGQAQTPSSNEAVGRAAVCPGPVRLSGELSLARAAKATRIVTSSAPPLAPCRSAPRIEISSPYRLLQRHSIRLKASRSTQTGRECRVSRQIVARNLPYQIPIHFAKADQ